MRVSEPTRAQADTWQGTEPLPVGKAVLLEASAGTGKTWQIAHLVARLVVLECIPVHELLVITFTKAATAELRDRIRRRLVAVRDVLERDAEPQRQPVRVVRSLGPGERRDGRLPLARPAAPADGADSLALPVGWLVPGIGDPLGHVARHVEAAPRGAISRERADRRRADGHPLQAEAGGGG